jgi:membrane fusion protein (multidrug efflux system)
MAFTVALVVASIWYWRYSERYVSTDDAYLNANVVQIASKVAGQVQYVYVINNQYVEKNKMLFELNDAPFKIAVEKAKAQLAIDETNLKNAIVTSSRVDALVKTNVSEKLESTKSAIKLDQTHVEQAQLNLQYTHIYAPTDGWVTNMSLREGDSLNANQAVFTLISNGEFWLDAHFKETDLAKIEPGQRAKVELDMYKRHPFHGWVEMKQNQNSSVRIRIINKDNRYPMRIGVPGKVTIDLQSGKDGQVRSE